MTKRDPDARAGQKSVLRAASDLCACAPGSEARLREKLLRRGYGADEIAEALGILRASGLLDEASNARVRASYLCRASLYGRSVIRAMLRTEGYGAETIGAIDFDDEGEFDFIAAARKRLKRRGGAGPKDLAALIRAGFTASEAREAARLFEE